MRVRNRKMKQMLLKPNVKGIAPTILPRQQAPEEQHRFQAATDALLTELVRRQMGRGETDNG